MKVLLCKPCTYMHVCTCMYVCIYVCICYLHVCIHTYMVDGCVHTHVHVSHMYVHGGCMGVYIVSRACVHDGWLLVQELPRHGQVHQLLSGSQASSGPLQAAVSTYLLAVTAVARMHVRIMQRACVCCAHTQHTHTDTHTHTHRVITNRNSPGLSFSITGGGKCYTKSIYLSINNHYLFLLFFVSPRQEDTLLTLEIVTSKILQVRKRKRINIAVVCM